MQIYRDTLAALLAAASASGRPGSVVVVCSVEAGVSCHFAQGRADDAGLVGLAKRLIQELGNKLVEHAPRRQVLLRCEANRAGCEIDLGEGYVPLPVIAGSGDA